MLDGFEIRGALEIGILEWGDELSARTSLLFPTAWHLIYITLYRCGQLAYYIRLNIGDLNNEKVCIPFSYTRVMLSSTMIWKVVR